MEHRRKQERKREEKELKDRKERIQKAKEDHERARKEEEERRQAFSGRIKCYTIFLSQNSVQRIRKRFFQLARLMVFNNFELFERK